VGFYFLRMADACVMAVILVLLMLIAVFFCLKWLQQNEEA
jgi:ABC-type sugar transport system permease subunit